MIRNQDILDRAAEWQLRADVVEKDYVLGWLLAGIAAHPETRTHWVFKGGTCIKKCYFETYRFSEDLDFSLAPEAPYTDNAILENLRIVARLAGEMSGVEFPIDQIVLNPSRNRQGQPTYQGRIYYRGPLGARNLSRVIFDLTRQEQMVDPPALLTVFHPYGDVPESAIVVSAYSLPELVAEKMRALYERTRPRDLYDVVYLLENRIDVLDLNRVREILRQKCVAKQIPVPGVEQFVRKVNDDAELKAEWGNMLAHQLPSLPNVDDFIARFAGMIAWLDQPKFVPVETTLPYVTAAADEVAVAPPGIQYWGHGLPLETVRFAGANRLLLQFSYHGRERLVEPYSVRRAQSTGNTLLYAWELASQQIKAFKVHEMMGARATDRAFTPRYHIELNTQGSISIPAVSSRPGLGYARPRASQPRATSSFGPTYVIECLYCHKRFRRKTYDTALNKHKTKDGWNCPGTVGYLVDTQY